MRKLHNLRIKKWGSIRRITRDVGAFPVGRRALMLVAARLRHITSTKCRYLDTARLQQSQETSSETVWKLSLYLSVGKTKVSSGKARNVQANTLTP